MNTSLMLVVYALAGIGGVFVLYGLWMLAQVALFLFVKWAWRDKRTEPWRPGR